MAVLVRMRRKPALSLVFIQVNAIHALIILHNLFVYMRTKLIPRSELPNPNEV